jgi:RNA-directed DNA polymerase
MRLNFPPSIRKIEPLVERFLSLSIFFMAMITTLENMAEEMGVNAAYLRSLYIYSDKFYNTYYLKKSSGKDRVIDSPNYEIKSVQSWILRNILEKIPISDRAHGFVKNRGIKTNAKCHLSNKYIMCLDIKDFFPSIGIDRVTQVFNSCPLTSFLSTQLAKLCTFRGRLPQGGVTSPYLSNIIFKGGDDKIVQECNARGIIYSRYADDLTFSNNNYDRLTQLLPAIEKIVSEMRFSLNKSKTRLFSGKERKAVTGVLLNSGRLTTGRKRKRRIRAQLFNFLVKRDPTVNLNKVLGEIAFIRDIEPAYGKKCKEYKNKLVTKFPLEE